MFTLEYDVPTNQYVGRCSLYPLFSHYADTPEEAMTGIQALVEGLDEDNEMTDVEANPNADTDVDGMVVAPIDDFQWASGTGTDPNWPPLPKKPGVPSTD